MKAEIWFLLVAGTLMVSVPLVWLVWTFEGLENVDIVPTLAGGCVVLLGVGFLSIAWGKVDEEPEFIEGEVE